MWACATWQRRRCRASPCLRCPVVHQRLEPHPLPPLTRGTRMIHPKHITATRTYTYTPGRSARPRVRALGEAEEEASHAVGRRSGWTVLSRPSTVRPTTIQRTLWPENLKHVSGVRTGGGEGRTEYVPVRHLVTKPASHREPAHPRVLRVHRRRDIRCNRESASSSECLTRWSTTSKSESSSPV